MINVIPTNQKLYRQADTKYWDESRWLLERETLYLALEYATFFLGKATATKILFDLLLGPEPISNGNFGISSVIPVIETNARRRLDSRINVIFAIGQRTSTGDSLEVRGAGGIFDNIFLSEDKRVAEWQEESVAVVTMAMSEYASAARFSLQSLLSRLLIPQNLQKCQSFFPQN